MYLFLKIHKRLYDAAGRPVISNCVTPTEKVSEFLDHHFKPVMQEGESCLLETCSIYCNILVIGDVVDLYPSVPRQAGLEALREAVDKRKTRKVPTSKLVKMVEFVLKNNYFQFSDISNFLEQQYAPGLLLLLYPYLWIKWKVSS